MSEKRIDPIPDNFESYEAAGEFWDTHDPTDYLDQFLTDEVTAELSARFLELRLTRPWPGICKPGQRSRRQTR
jgi:hypothetical protein